MRPKPAINFSRYGFNLAPHDKAVCISETSMDGTPSYVELHDMPGNGTGCEEGLEVIQGTLRAEGAIQFSEAGSVG